MDPLKVKLNEIIDFDTTAGKKAAWHKDEILSLEEKYQIDFPKDYISYLKEYGNDYLDPSYKCIPEETPPDFNKFEFELDSIFGLHPDVNNLIEQIKSYQGIIPEHVFPIADLPGGDLVCMDKKTGSVYFWFHDREGNKMSKVFDSFREFILGFTKVEDQTSNTEIVEITFENGLDAFLRNFSPQNGLKKRRGDFDD
ncbi:SMI1/KNR4 family protein [Rossellomorea marisflavi]|uniref:SMI1/KNR4 family protein n=1 Tax=Rossellomorea marisflavi TaxID=189381 RepID=UPI00203C78B7|nr:SMI1/KNR4 family protein [Rossellomorea marisflavi]MCM2604220.1 SMI1/KNR4 family protein [Rossellomorea marisflavi]